MKRKLLILFLCILGGADNTIVAQTRSSTIGTSLDPRGPAELTVCSQNLENYALYEDIKTRGKGLTVEEFKIKEDALTGRFATAKCDVIAVQEVVSRSELQGEAVLQQLANALRRKTGRIFAYKTGPSNDKNIRNGFLVAQDRGKIEHVASYYKIELPKLSDDDKPLTFSRGPLELQMTANGREGTAPKTVSLVTFHFKSKFAGAHDPSKLEWETHRMMMAEALRRIVSTRFARSFASGESILILLGDRNSNFDSSSARILEGSLTLKDFRAGVCRMSKRGVPLCKAGAYKPPRLFSVLTNDPQTKLSHGSYIYKEIYSWLDEILLPAESLRFAWANPMTEGDYDSGVIRSSEEASDHGLVWVRLNW